MLTGINVGESFCGDIEGDGVVEFLQAARADGSASFVGSSGSPGTGRAAGTFLLQDAGTVEGSIVSGDWFVVPGRAPASWPGFAARAGSAPTSARAPRCTWTTGSNEAPAPHRHQPGTCRGAGGPGAVPPGRTWA